MEEKTAQYIMTLVLEQKWHVKLSPKPSGVDFRYKGKAVEVKGSDFRFAANVGQFVSYAQEYDEVALAFPADAIGASNLFELHLFASMMQPAFGKRLGLFLISEDTVFYHVVETSDARELFGTIIYALQNIPELKSQNASEVKNNIEGVYDMLDDLLRTTSGVLTSTFQMSATSRSYMFSKMLAGQTNAPSPAK